MAEAKLTLTAVDQTRQAFESVRRNFGDLERAAGSLRGVLGGIGAGLSAGAFVGFVRNAINAADALDDLAQKSGVSVQSLSELGYVAKIEGVSMESLGDTLRRLNVSLQEAGAGSKNLQAAFQAVGISTAELRTIGTDAALLRIADAFAGAEDGAGKAALAVRLLGRQGTELIPLLNRGAAGLREAGDEARRFGLVVSSEAAAAAGQFNDNMTRFTAGAQAFGIALGNFALPSLTKFTEELLEGSRIFGSFASALFNIGFAIDPFKSLGENLAKTRKEIEALQKSLAATPLTESRTRAAIETQIDTLQKRLEFLKFQERQRIQAGGDSTLDARDRRLRQGQQRGQLQVPEDPSTTRDTTAADLERGTQRAAEFLVNVYTQQFDRLRSEAQQVNADLIAILQQGPDEAARQVAARAAAIEGLLGQTQIGRVRELQQALDDLAAAGAKAPAAMQEQYEQAFEIINQEIERTKGNLEKIPEVTSDAEKAIKRLEAAIERWGDASAEEIVKFAKTGKLEFSALVDTILTDLLRLTVQQTITRPLFTAFAGAIGVGGGGSGGGGGGGGTFTGLQMRAAGGPVMAGTPYIVGERGPELFVPNSSGGIVPNNRLGGPTLQQTIYIDSRSDVNSVRQAVYQASALANAEMSRMNRRG